MTFTELEFENRAESMVEQARRRAVEAHPHLANLPTSGPVAAMLLARGFSVARVETVVNKLVAVFTESVPGKPEVLVSNETVERFMECSHAAVVEFAETGVVKF